MIDDRHIGVRFETVTVDPQQIGVRVEVSPHLVDGPARRAVDEVTRSVERFADESDCVLIDPTVRVVVEGHGYGYRRPPGLNRERFERAVQSARRQAGEVVVVQMVRP